MKKPRRTPPSHFPTPFHRIGKISQRMRKPAPPFNRKARRIAAAKARNQDK